MHLTYSSKKEFKGSSKSHLIYIYTIPIMIIYINHTGFLITAAWLIWQTLSSWAAIYGQVVRRPKRSLPALEVPPAWYATGPSNGQPIGRSPIESAASQLARPFRRGSSRAATLIRIAAQPAACNRPWQQLLLWLRQTLDATGNAIRV